MSVYVAKGPGNLTLVDTSNSLPSLDQIHTNLHPSVERLLLLFVCRDRLKHSPGDLTEGSIS
jgi:hypothetical protein